jgi:hypothetical protein
MIMATSKFLVFAKHFDILHYRPKIVNLNGVTDKSKLINF